MSETSVCLAFAQMPTNLGQSQRYSTTASLQVDSSLSDKQGIITPVQTGSMILEGKIDDTSAQISHLTCIECGARLLFTSESRKITCFCGQTIEIGKEGTLFQQDGIRKNPAILAIFPAIQSGKTEQECAWLVQGNESMGLANSGLTCYFNSALNSLYFVPQFHRLFFAEEQPSDPSLLSLLKQFVKNYGKRDLSIRLLASIRWEIPSFRHEGMGSAYEFILGLLQRIDEEVENYVEMDSVPPGEAWERELTRRKLSGCLPLHDIFSAVLEETLSCSGCKSLITRHLYQRSLSLDLTPNYIMLTYFSYLSFLICTTAINAIMLKII